jgi:hypothetical protein
LPSKPTHEARARRYLQASMHAGYTGLPPEHREAYEQQMRAHERAYSRVREHALAGADRDFDRPLTPGEREHQRHLRTHEGLQEHDVHRIRGELRNPGGQERHVASRSRRRGAGAGAGPRAAAAAAGAAGGAIPGIGGNTGMYLLGVGLLLCLLYLLIYGKGAHAITGIVNTLVGGVDAFVRPIDPLAKLETALGATSIAAQAAVGIPEKGSTPRAYGSPITGSKKTFASEFAKLTGLNSQVVEAWMNHEQGSTTVEGGNNWLNIETGEPGGGSGPYGPSAKGMERLSPEQAALATAQWIAKNQPQILAARGKGPGAEVQAIEDSGFAESHYGNVPASTFLAGA